MLKIFLYIDKLNMHPTRIKIVSKINRIYLY